MKSLRISDFPSERDETIARWWPIQMEPIPASGERFTIGVAVVGKDGAIRIQMTPGLEKLRYILGEEAHVIERAARITLSALEQHFLHHGGAESVGEFVPPFASVKLGEPRSASGGNLDGIVRQAIALSSSIAEIPRAEVHGIEGASSASKAITEAVREIVVKEYPQLADSFNVPLYGRASRKAPILGFVNRETVANFGVVGAARINQSLEKARNGMWALDLYRTLHPDLSPRIYRMYLQRPSVADITLPREKAKEIDEACAEVVYEGTQKDLTVDIYDSPEAIAKDLLTRVHPNQRSLM
jgi:hypothetical protein